MSCPNCNYKELNGNMCPDCGIDIVLFKKTTKISDLLYNKAISQAKLNDLSGAIDSLNKSVGFNKNNVNARNLLGLAYFEVGHLGDALKHWVISTSIRKEGNFATKYLEKMQQKGEYLENLSDSIKMYNEALGYILEKNDDVAIIRLKRSIELNPKFVDALNLMAFCCLIQKDKANADDIVKRVFAIDINNAIASNYYKELHNNKPNSIPVQRNANSTMGSPTSPTYRPLNGKDKKNFENNFHLPEIVSFLIGVGCALAITYILIIPGLTSALEQENADLALNIKTTQDAYSKEKTENAAKVQELETKNSELEKQNQELAAKASEQEKIGMVVSAANLYDQGDIQGSADLLYSIDLEGLSQETVDTAEELKDEVYPLAAKKYHDQGIAKYNAGENDEAKALFEKCLLLAEPDVSYMDSVIYYLGLIAEEEGDVVTAKQNYEKIMNEYPNSKFYSKAKNRYNNLDEG